jgi:hypothetical protein
MRFLNQLASAACLLISIFYIWQNEWDKATWFLAMSISLDVGNLKGNTI